MYKSIVPIFILIVSSSLFARETQNTGNIPPKNYILFKCFDTSHVLRIAKNYLPENPVIVEAGAYDGIDSCQLANFWPNSQVHAFEPVSELYKKVLENAFDFPNLFTYQLALGDGCYERTMYLSHEIDDATTTTKSSSLLPPKDHLVYAKETRFNNREKVKVVDLDSWAEEYDIQKIDMLWLDMQGFELPALKAMPKILETVSVILTEVDFCEAYKGQFLYKDVKSWLEDQGFVLIAGDFTFPKNPLQWFGDALFVRRTLVK